MAVVVSLPLATGCTLDSPWNPEARPGTPSGAAVQSLMEPHALPEKGPWFEGWYARFTPPRVDQPSVGVIVGSHLSPGQEASEAETTGLPGFVSILVSQGNNAPLLVLNKRVPRTFMRTGDGRFVARDPLPSQRAEFAWVAEGVGELSATSIRLQDADAGWTFEADFSPRPRSFAWDLLLGPAGPATMVRAIPLQWFVYSQDLEARWKLTLADGTIVSNTAGGRAHYEKNWGKEFPERYVWLQGHDSRQGISVAAAGGELEFVPDTNVAVEAFMIMVRKGDRRWLFAPTNGGVFSQRNFESCAGRLALKMQSLDGEISLQMSAPRPSFGTILIPSGTGFVPGSEQSFQATLKGRLTPRGGEAFDFEIPASALEFGGSYKCGG